MMDNIWNVFYSLRIQDIFDIAIISVMLSVLLVWFRDRASRFVFVGISLLGIVYILARFFQLYLTTIVLQGFFAILLFVLVVIFQEDLRRFFEYIASWGIMKKSAPSATANKGSAEIIARTVANLARRKIGALIVIQGIEPLDRHLRGGNALDGALSQPLLESIFDPHSAGHDGAVLIDGNRVVRFGCHLPLSPDVGQYTNLGLRHTAARGLSERSDAICIVVSEERGTISLARGEHLEEIATAAGLETVLESFYAQKNPAKTTHPFYRWLKENTREKVVAILFACVLWFIFGYQGASIRRDFVIPIEYVNLSPRWFIESPRETKARIILSGPFQAFRLLDQATLKVALDLSQVENGKQEITLSRDMVNVPSNISLVEIKPSRIRITASPLVSMQLPVEVVTENLPPPGLVVQRITVSPLFIRVLAPRTLRQNITRIRTEPIDLRSFNGTRTISPKLVLPADVQFETPRPPSVSVTVRMGRTPFRRGTQN